MIALALTAAAGSASARKLSAVDALSVAPQETTKQETHFSKGALSTFRGHFEERLGVPTFLDASDKTPRLSASLLVSNDRGTPGNLLYVTGVSLTDAPATSTTTPAPVPVGAALVAVVAANASRRALRIYNQGPDPATLGPAGHTWAKRAVVIEAGQTFFEDRAANLATYAICEAGKAATLGIQEVIA